MQPQPFEVKLTRHFILNALYSQTIADRSRHEPEIEFTDITIDSRKVTPGSLFVALKGEKLDGHDYIETAVQNGARGILCKKNTTLSTPGSDVTFFYTDDPLRAFRRLASIWRKEFAIPVVVVAGSAGKTTTKEILAAILSGKWESLVKTEGSQNGMIGIPLTLMELRSHHQAAVIEVGIDEIGTMDQHMTLVQPNAAVLTSIGPEHLERLQDLPTVAKEEGIALAAVTQTGGLAAISLDDPWIKPHAFTLKTGKKVYFSLQPETAANLPEEKVALTLWGELSPNEKKLTFWGLNSDRTTLSLPLPGRHNASNLLAALTVAHGLGLTIPEIKNGLKRFQGATGRSEVQELPGPVTVICDYYNAQPASMNAGLDLLSSLARQSGQKGSRWACLADMLELGTFEEKFHRELAPKILQSGIENVFLYGPRMKALYEELRTLGFPHRLSHFLTHEELNAALIPSVRPNDTILIKGSRGMKMEQIWNVLESHTRSQRESKNP